ncbi:hypothetical protein RFI_27658, partial [Reticulomyxa filosa]
DVKQVIPWESNSKKTYDRLLSSDLPAGMTSPLYVIIDSGSDDTLWNDLYFNTTALVYHQIVQEFQSELNSDWISNIAVVDGVSISYQMAFDIVHNVNNCINQPGAKDYKYLFESLVNDDNTSAIMEIIPPFDTESKQGNDLISHLRNLLKRLMKDSTYSFYLTGSPVNGYDSMTVTFDFMPFVVLGTFIVIFIFVGFAFRSLFIPLRYCVGLCIPLSFVFGMSVLIYQDGIFNDVFHFQPLSSTIGPMYWFVPVLCFSLCCGLALDYDIFLASRVYEFRMSGYDNNSSIVKAVYETGI